MDDLHRSGRGNIEPDHLHPDLQDEKYSPHKRVRAMCFTKYGDEIAFDEKLMKYLCYGPETCPTSGRFHWQGYVYWKEGRNIGACATKYKCTFLACKGGVESNRRYCGLDTWVSRDGSKKKEPNPDFKEFGTVPKQGKRTDLIELRNEIQNGLKVEEICMDAPDLYHQYGRTLNKIEDLVMRKKFRTEMTTAEWLWGPTGVGKSHRAFEGFTPETHYVLINDNGWWDGYNQQHTIIINDFRGWINYNELLQLIDKWPHQVRRRHREPLPFTSKHIIITSSLPPCEVYKHRNEEDSLEQLIRRCKVERLE